MKYVSATELEEEFFDRIGIEETFDQAVLPEDKDLRNLMESVMNLRVAYWLVRDAFADAVNTRANEEMRESDP